MCLIEEIEEWKKYPNCLGSESQAAVLVGEVAAALGEAIPDNVSVALRVLSLRGAMRDIASAIGHGEVLNPAAPSFHNLVDTAAASCGLSWAEALAVVTKHLDERKQSLSTGNPPARTWVYFASAAQADRQATIGFAANNNVVWRGARNATGALIANVANLAPGDQILLVYRQKGPRIVRLCATIADVTNPVEGTRVIDRIGGQAAQELLQAGYRMRHQPKQR